VRAPECRYRPLLIALEDRAVPSFVSAATYAAGSDPFAVAVGDFTGNGILDLAFVNRDAGTVKVLLGNGDGSFQSARSFATAGTIPVAVVVGDFNGDGVPDLAVENSGSNTVSVLLGNGDGSFQPARTFATGGRLGSYRYPDSLTVGDFTGKGILDLAVANHDSGTVGVLLGHGDGTFQPARTFAAGTSPSAIAVGDFNRDGALDLVVANDHQAINSRPGVNVLLGNGDGSFQAPRSVLPGGDPVSVAVGDFRGDGIPDLAVAESGFGGDVLLGNGDGSFHLVQTLAGTYPSAVADLNGDGIPDLVAIGSNTVGVLLGNGDGSFQPTINYAVDNSPTSVAVGDFTGSGPADIAVADLGIESSSSGVDVLLNNGDGSFRAARNYAAGIAARAVATGDFNGDGIRDLAVAERDSNGGTVEVLLGNGDGSFQAPRPVASAGDPNSLAVGDFNGDGILDLAVTTPGGVEVLLGNGDGTFQAPSDYATGGQTPLSVVVADLNGDGIADLVVANNGSGTVGVLLGNGDGSFQPARTFAAGTQPDSVAVGDFHGDGIPDLAVVNFQSNTVGVLLGNGDGSFQARRLFQVPGNLGASSVAVADLTGTGVADLVVATAGVFQGSVNVLLGNGDGTFQPVQTFAAGLATPLAITVGDFNGDGIPDIVTATGDSPGYENRASVLLGVGDGTFQTPRTFAAGFQPVAMAVGDFTGAGRPDLAVADVDGQGGVTVLLNDGLWDSNAPDWDQRGPGFRRVVNGTIDIGAYEVQAHARPTGQPLPDPVPVQALGMPGGSVLRQPPDLPADSSPLPEPGNPDAQTVQPAPVPTATGQQAPATSFGTYPGTGQPMASLGSLSANDLDALALNLLGGP
jgi:hypothetical protein